jgi:hypothetical protein
MALGLKVVSQQKWRRPQAQRNSMDTMHPGFFAAQKVSGDLPPSPLIPSLCLHLVPHTRRTFGEETEAQG